MIVVLIVSLVFIILNLFISLIPEFNLNVDIAGYISTLSNFVGYIDTFISLDVIVLCISLILIVDNFSFLFKLLSWLWEKIPFN